MRDVTQDRRESLGRWIGSFFTFKDMVKGITLVVLLAGSYFTLIQRISLLEYQETEDKQEIKLLHDQLEHVGEKIEKLSDKVDEVNTNVKVVQSQLDDYGPSSYVYRPYKGAGPGKVKKY